MSALKSTRWRPPAPPISIPVCTRPSPWSRAPTPASSSIRTAPCSSTPARIRPRTYSPEWRSRMTLSIPAPYSSWPSARPEGPAPAVAPCVRLGVFNPVALKWGVVPSCDRNQPVKGIRVAQQRFARCAMDDTPAFQHDRLARELQSELRVLLDDDHGHAARRHELADHGPELLHD